MADALIVLPTGGLDKQTNRIHHPRNKERIVMHLVRLSSALICAAMLSVPVVAQTPVAATTASKTTHAQTVTTTKTTKTNAPVQRTAKSLDCSKQADAKNVHGKARKTFMSSCKKA